MNSRDVRFPTEGGRVEQEYRSRVAVDRPERLFTRDSLPFNARLSICELRWYCRTRFAQFYTFQLHICNALVNPRDLFQCVYRDFNSFMIFDRAIWIEYFSKKRLQFLFFFCESQKKLWYFFVWRKWKKTKKMKLLNVIRKSNRDPRTMGVISPNLRSWFWSRILRIFLVKYDGREILLISQNIYIFFSIFQLIRVTFIISRL